jgi:hypothetical protein
VAQVDRHSLKISVIAAGNMEETMNCYLKIKESADKEALKRKEELDEILPLFEGKYVGEDYRS